MRPSYISVSSSSFISKFEITGSPHQNSSNLAQKWRCLMGRGKCMGIGIAAPHHGESISTSPIGLLCNSQLTLESILSSKGLGKEKKIITCERKPWNSRSFTKLPLSSRKWPGSIPQELGNSDSSCSTEVSDVNISMPWKEQMKINKTMEKPRS